MVAATGGLFLAIAPELAILLVEIGAPGSIAGYWIAGPLALMALAVRFIPEVSARACRTPWDLHLHRGGLASLRISGHCRAVS